MLLNISVQISSVKCNIKKKRGGGRFLEGGALYGEDTVAQIQAIWPKSKRNGPIPSIIALIQAKWPKSF